MIRVASDMCSDRPPETGEGQELRASAPRTVPPAGRSELCATRDEPVFRVEIRLKNHRLIRAREDLGWTQAEAARQIGVNDSMLSVYENFRESPWGAEGWKPTALRIAEFYGFGCEYLWPDAVDAVTRNRFEVTLAAGVVEGMIGEHSRRLLLPAPGDTEHLAADMARLPERVRRVLLARFDEGLTLDEVGERERVQRERIRQIEAKGVRLLAREHARRARRVEAVREARGLEEER